jgi:hypothetical protein
MVLFPPHAFRLVGKKLQPEVLPEIAHSLEHSAHVTHYDTIKLMLWGPIEYHSDHHSTSCCDLPERPENSLTTRDERRQRRRWWREQDMLRPNKRRIRRLAFRGRRLISDRRAYTTQYLIVLKLYANTKNRRWCCAHKSHLPNLHGPF